MKPNPFSWSEADVTTVYNQRNLDVFLKRDLVVQASEIHLVVQLTGTVLPVLLLRTLADAITALVTLLHEADRVAGRFELGDMLTLGFDLHSVS